MMRRKASALVKHRAVECHGVGSSRHSLTSDRILHNSCDTDPTGEADQAPRADKLLQLNNCEIVAKRNHAATTFKQCLSEVGPPARPIEFLQTSAQVGAEAAVELAQCVGKLAKEKRLRGRTFHYHCASGGERGD